jgi:hypothetical protein
MASMSSEEPSAEESKVCDEKCNKLMGKAQAETAKTVGINPQDVDNPQLLTEALRDEFSIVYDKSLEDFYHIFSESKFPQITEAIVQSESNKILKKVIGDYRVKKLMDSSNQHKVAFVESFLSGLHDSLMELCLEK